MMLLLCVALCCFADVALLFCVDDEADVAAFVVALFCFACFVWCGVLFLFYMI